MQPDRLGAVKRIYKLNPEGVWVVKKNQSERFVTKLGEPREWVMLLPFGRWASRGIEVTQELAQKIVDNFKKGVLDYSPPINIEHEDAHGARGRITDVRVGEGGLEVKPEFTAKAAQEIGEDMFPYTSAEIDLDYEHKESGEKVGPALLGMALTLRPYLGSRTALYNEDTGDYESFEEHMKPEIQGVVEAVNALVRAYNGRGDEDEEDGGEEEEMGEVLGLAEWDARYINDLPDSAFLYVAPGGEKDDEGRTKPRTLRKLPYRNAAGDVDLPHLRNALSRLPQTDLPADVRQTLIKKAQALLTRETEQSEPGFEYNFLFGGLEAIKEVA